MNSNLIDTYLWGVRRYVRNKLGIDAGDRAMYPLMWYINTGRASTDFLKRLLNTKEFVIGRILIGGGNYDEVIRKIKSKLKVRDIW